MPRHVAAAMNGSRLSCYDYIGDTIRSNSGRTQLYLHEDILSGMFSSLALPYSCCFELPFIFARPFCCATGAGGLSGAIASFFGSPFYLVKTQQQSRVVGAEGGYQVKLRETNPMT
jgi:hypothetical protein